MFIEMCLTLHKTAGRFLLCFRAQSISLLPSFTLAPVAAEKTSYLFILEFLVNVCLFHKLNYNPEYSIDLKGADVQNKSSVHMGKRCRFTDIYK